MSKRILIGKITSAHGIKGLVKIFPMCEDTDLLNGTLFIDESGSETVEVKTKNFVGKFLLAEIKGVTDRNVAEKLKCSLFILRESLPELDQDDAFYIEDIINLDVYDTASQKIGTVLSVNNFGASDLIEIQPVSGKAFYIPYTDDYVIDINIEDHKIIVQNVDDFKEI